jgi:formate dehydrogenase iron-sulfur subunit
MKVNRRTFLKIVTAAGSSGLVGQSTRAQAAALDAAANPVGMLVDTTRCLGCRACEAACSEKNHLAEPVRSGDPAVFEVKRTTDSHAYTVVNRYANPKEGGEPTYVKTQCMHCLQPACASACPVKALEKTSEGPVIYHKDRCIGCRYCMVACPFNITKFEYETPFPYVRKCQQCYDRLQQGKIPACAEACPGGALTFGKRAELLEIAKTRIYQNPDQYVHHIYGEHEVGGTGWLYISDVPFEKLGFSMHLGTKPYPEFTQGALSMVPFVLIMWPPLLMGLYTFAKKGEEAVQNENDPLHGKEARHESIP